MENEPKLKIEFIPGEKNTAADWLSRPISRVCVVTRGGKMTTIKNDSKAKNINDKNDKRDRRTKRKKDGKGRGQFSIENLIWWEHCRGHYGPDKIYMMMKLQGQ